MLLIYCKVPLISFDNIDFKLLYLTLLSEIIGVKVTRKFEGFGHKP